MPFEPIGVLPSSPLVTAYLSGLLLIRCLNESSCDIGVVNNEPSHILKISLRVIEPASTRTIVLHHGSLDTPFRIDVERATQPGVFAFQDPDHAFARNPRRDNGRDLRWAIDLEGDEFHREPLSANLPLIHPGLSLNNGGVFHTAERTDEDSLKISRSRSGVYGMSSIAAIIGASIDVVPDSHVTLQWSGAGRPLILPRPDDKPGARYELIVSNEPPEATTDSDELANYYAVLKKNNGTAIPDGEKWMLDVGPHSLLLKTDEIPCMPVILNGGR
jgi:hypothetical protein